MMCARKETPPRPLREAAVILVRDPAMTDFRARGTIMGLTGLTAVFGMGTGGAPSVSSPESGRGAVGPRGRGQSGRVGTRRHGRAWSVRASGEGGGISSRGFIHQPDRSRMRSIEFATLMGIRVGRDRGVSPDPRRRPGRARWGPRRRVGVVKPFGC